MSNDRNVSPRTNAREAVLHLSRALLRAVNNSDVAGAAGVWSTNGLLMPPHHPTIRGRASITEYFTQLFSQGRFVFEFTASSVEVSGDIATEHVEYTAVLFPAGSGEPAHDRGKGLHVFRQQSNGEWRLVMDIWNSDER